MKLFFCLFALATLPCVVPGSTLTAQQAAQPNGSIEQARLLTEEGKALFSTNDFKGAKVKLDEVVRLVPQSSDAYQFRSLIAFAMQDYESAAADAYDAMSKGNSWTTQGIKSFYGGRLRPYQKQFAQLKRFVREDSSMPGHFLLAYHHVIHQQWGPAKIQLEHVLKLQPEEPLSTKLLSVVKAKVSQQQAGQTASSR